MTVLFLRSLSFSLLLTCLVIALPISSMAQYVFERQILAAEDDAEESALNSNEPGTVYLYSTDLELVRDDQHGRGAQFVGLRFDQVNLPAGAQIVHAWLQFTCDEIDQVPGQKVIRMQDAANPGGFAFLPFNLSSRPLSSDSVVWSNIPAWNHAGDAGPAQRSPDLASLVQNMVDRPDWQSGQAMVFMLTGEGTRVADAFDGDDRYAPRLIVEYLDGTYPVGSFPIKRKRVWRYFTGPYAPTGNWTAPSYDDTTWAFGLGVLGYGHGDEQTWLDFGPDPSQKYPTSYFRHHFDVDQPGLVDSLVLRSRHDDGLVLYLNGVEILRENLPTGSIDHQTYALQPIDGPLETTYREYRVAAQLQAGTNVLAAEVHQASGHDPDLSFDLSVQPARHPLGATILPIYSRSEWAFRDSVVNLDSSGWALPGYDDRTWKYGQGPLGYGNPQVTTALSFGGDPNLKPMTAYFRREVYVDDLDQLPDSLMLALMRDDGAVIYINGQEAWRSNMPVGEVNYQTPAASSVGGSDQTRYYPHLISSGYFQEGLNVIAVEVHQRSANSSDLLFDLQMLPTLSADGPALGCANGDLKDDHLGCFVSVKPQGQQERLLLPRSHRFQLLLQTGQTYTNGGQIPEDPHFAGFQALPGSPQHGKLWLTHEVQPGQLSVADLHYDAQDRLWVIDQSAPLNMDWQEMGAIGALAGATFTPWGTLLMAESSHLAGDLNGDGFDDQGWAWEWDLATGEPVSDGSGTKQKLWAMGRMPRHSVAITADGSRAYFGSMGTDGRLYRYDLTSPEDLTSGQLYVLQLVSGLAGAEHTQTQGEWRSLGSPGIAQLNDLMATADSLGTDLGRIGRVRIHPTDGGIYLAAADQGHIYRFFEGSNLQIEQFESYVGGQSYRISDLDGSQITDWSIGHLDFAFDDRANLWVLQGQREANIWMVRPDHTRLRPRVELFATTPVDSKPVGLSFSADYRFMFISLQDPSPVNDPQPDATMQLVRLDEAATLVIARREHLGPQPPEVDFTTDRVEIRVGDIVTFTDLSFPEPDTLIWDFGMGYSLSNPGMPSQRVQYLAEGAYDVQLIAATVEGGRDTLRKANHILVSATLGLEDELAGDAWQAYPNPVVERLTLAFELSQARTVAVELWTLEGRRLAQWAPRRLAAGQQAWSLDLSDYHGTLVLRVAADDEQVSRIIRVH